MEKDLFDMIREQWSQERPDLDPSGLEVVGRILLLSNHLRRNSGRKLTKSGLDLWAYEVLSTLRRHGAPYRLSPTELSRAAMISSGAMTNRLDRLEVSGLIERIPDPNDRRGVLIELTPNGRELVDLAVEERFKEATHAIAVLNENERRALIQLLRKLLAPQSKIPERRRASNQDTPQISPEN